MTVKLQKVGNSMMITLPKKIIKEAGFKRGDQLEVVMVDGEVKVQKKKAKKSLADFAGIIKLPKSKYFDHIQILKDSKNSGYERLEKFLPRR